MSYSSILKSTVSLNTMNIFFLNAPVAECQNIGYRYVKLMVSNSCTQTKFEPLNFCFCEPEPDNLKYFVLTETKPAKSNDVKPEPEVA